MVLSHSLSNRWQVLSSDLSNTVCFLLAARNTDRARRRSQKPVWPSPGSTGPPRDPIRLRPRPFCPQPMTRAISSSARPAARNAVVGLVIEHYLSRAHSMKVLLAVIYLEKGNASSNKSVPTIA